jgi:hypothetical protein
MSNPDERIGKAVHAARATATQKSVADAMRRKGHKWSQSTVWAVEKGDRTLKLTEAHDLVEILGVTVDDLTADTEDLEARLLMRRYAERRGALVDAVDDLFAAQEDIEELLRGDQDLPAATVEALEQMAREAVDLVVADARRRGAERIEHGDDVPDEVFAEHEAQDRLDWERGK